jgi:4-hydroxybenzoate polyprenyltransferase
MGFKNYYTSFFWAISIFLIPLFYKINNIAPYLYLLAFLFFRIVINTVFFDLKDTESDKARGIKTFPAEIGKDKTIFFLHILNLFSFLPIILGIIYNQLPTTVLFLLITVIGHMYYLIYARSSNDENLRKLSYILIDGEYILWPLIILVGRYFLTLI